MQKLRETVVDGVGGCVAAVAAVRAAAVAVAVAAAVIMATTAA